MSALQQPTRADSRERRADWTAELLASVWEHQRERIRMRIATLESAVAALARDRLQETARGDAERAAHMLAGTLGMFGLPAAGAAARELERDLANRPSPARAPALAALLATVRAGVVAHSVSVSPTASAATGTPVAESRESASGTGS